MHTTIRSVQWIPPSVCNHPYWLTDFTEHRQQYICTRWKGYLYTISSYIFYFHESWSNIIFSCIWEDLWHVWRHNYLLRIPRSYINSVDLYTVCVHCSKYLSTDNTVVMPCTYTNKNTGGWIIEIRIANYFTKFVWKWLLNCIYTHSK